MGPQTLKNIAEPMQAWRIRLDGCESASATQSARLTSEPGSPLPDKPSIAVLPFQNMSGDPEQEYFADGIAEDIITALSRYRSLFVIARNSSFTYKGRAVDVKQVGRDLGVRYVLEGSVRKSGNRVRVTAQLIEAETGDHVWAERYDRELADIFAVQDEITQATTIAIAPAIADAEQQRAMRKPPASLDAWGAYQRGLWHLSRASAEDDALARRVLSAGHRSRSDVRRRIHRAFRRAQPGERNTNRRRSVGATCRRARWWQRGGSLPPGACAARARRSSGRRRPSRTGVDGLSEIGRRATVRWAWFWPIRAARRRTWRPSRHAFGSTPARPRW